jgi:hypothetical protein
MTYRLSSAAEMSGDLAIAGEHPPRSVGSFAAAGHFARVGYTGQIVY